MKYTLLLWPHANARYQQETRKLAANELRLMLSRLAPDAEVADDENAILPSLTITLPAPMDARTLSAIREHSLLYALFEAREDGSLVPVATRADAVLGADLPAILKYKGKTNEMFLQLMVNAALYAGDFWNAGDKLTLLDPMCGRATAPFIALNRGWDAVGADVDRADLKEAEQFFKRYLEYHRMKHSFARETRTVPNAAPAQVARFEVAATPELYRAKQIQTLKLITADATKCVPAVGKKSCHLIVCDLPYGVKHDAQVAPGAKNAGNWLEALLKQALPAFREVLKPGGAAAISFNAQTFPLHKLRAMMADAGFEVMQGGAYDGFEHWVEQAITRDVAVGVKR